MRDIDTGANSDEVAVEVATVPATMIERRLDEGASPREVVVSMSDGERGSRQRTLLVISVQPPDDLAADVAAGRQPRRDYVSLQQMLGADCLFPAGAASGPVGRFLARRFGATAALVWAAFRRRRSYGVIYTDRELTGLPLALLLRLSPARRRAVRHVTLAHNLTPAKKRLFFRLGARKHIDTLIVHGSAQREFATTRLGLPAHRVRRLPYFVDSDFWRPAASGATAAVPRPAADGPNALICAPGTECRDHATLFAAVAGLPVIVRCTATNAEAVHRSRARVNAADMGMEAGGAPANVQVAPCQDYAELRDLYAASRFVVVPLQDVDFPAGITVILEAMAMGKAVVVTGNRGQTDVVRDRRNGGRGSVARPWWAGFLDEDGAPAELANLPTGFYVAPNDPAELRRAITYLLEHAEVADELGRNGRKVAEAFFGIEAFTRRFAEAIRGR